jgi:hypothetical protein
MHNSRNIRSFKPYLLLLSASAAPRRSLFFCIDLRHDSTIDFFQHLMHNSGEILLQAVDITAIKGAQ